MTHFAKDLATTVTLTIAAAIGAVLFLTALTAITHHPAAGQPTHTTGTHVVACDTYLSHQAMVLNQVDGIGPAATTSFCTVTAS